MSDPTVPSSPSPEPAPGSASNVPPTVDPAAPTAGSGLAPNIAAALACVIPFVGGIIFLVLEKKDKFVRFYAMQSLVFTVSAIVLSIALQIVAMILVHIPFIGWLIGILLMLIWVAVGLGLFAIWVITAVKAYSGKEWEIPYLGKIAREQLVKFTPATP